MTARERSGTRREQIVDVALRIIATDGLARFTTAAIADAVGFTDGAIFRHFDTKEDIVLAAIDRVEQVFFADFPPPPPTRSTAWGRSSWAGSGPHPTCPASAT